MATFCLRKPVRPSESQGVGAHGALFLQDFHLIDLLAHFNYERIPRCVVHPKGAGGEFEATSDLTSASVFNGIGKKTKALCRFSPAGGEKGSADSARDPRGSSIKFYTEEGNLDWVFNNYSDFLRDLSKFPLFIHTLKRQPQTNLKDAAIDRGTLYSCRNMNDYSGYTYKFTKPDRSFHYVQIHLKSTQGNKTFTKDEAARMASENPIFNLTKVWPHKEFPLRPVGKVSLDRNPENYFAEIEQAAFSPSRTVPDFEPSADPHLPNCPLKAFKSFQRDGAFAGVGPANKNNYGFNQITLSLSALSPRYSREWVGIATSFHWDVTDEDYTQANDLWDVLGRTSVQQDNFVYNISVHLKNAQDIVKKQTYEMFSKANKDSGRRIENATEREVVLWEEYLYINVPVFYQIVMNLSTIMRRYRDYQSLLHE
ncbi:catalase-like domain-containing protein [Kalaharituber pfeilii]|nr:catalase-like domain-containing protein [Kalaharituber pfeilii]